MSGYLVNEFPKFEVFSKTQEGIITPLTQTFPCLRTIFIIICLNQLSTNKKICHVKPKKSRIFLRWYPTLIILTLPRCHCKLLLWSRPPYETQKNRHDTFPHQPLQIIFSPPCLCKFLSSPSYTGPLTFFLRPFSSPLGHFNSFRNHNQPIRMILPCSILPNTWTILKKSAINP